MSNFALAAFITLTKANGTLLHKWQSYQPGTVVDGFAFAPFSVSAIQDASSGSAGAMQVQLPISGEAWAIVANGVDMRYAADVSLEMFVPNTDGTMPPSRQVVARYVGEIVGGTINATTVVVEIGDCLDAVEAQAPHRVYTVALVGTPPKL